MAEIPVLEAAPKADKAKKGDKADGAKSEGAPAGGKKKLLIFIAIGVVALGGMGAGAWLMFGGKHDEAGGKGKTAEKGKAEEKHEAPKGPPLFLAMDPPFVVNFQSEQAVRFLQVTAQVMTRDLKTLEELKTSDPIIRNDLLLLFGNQKYDTVSTLEGKEQLRHQALEAVRKVIADNGGEPKNIEAVYFTSFVMQ